MGRLLLFAAGSLYSLLCAALYWQQERLIFRPEVLPHDFRFAFPQSFMEILLPVDGATLHGLHFQIPQAKGVILYFHGNSGSLQRWGEVAQSFTARGYDLFIVDYRGYGKSTGTITSEQQFLADADAAYAYVAERYPRASIVIYGRSLGTGVAAQIALRHPPKALFLEAPYFSLTDVTRQIYPFVPSALLRYPLRTDLALTEIKCPVYLIHGTADAVIPYASSERLLSLVRASKELVTIRGGEHNGLRLTPEYNAALDRLLQ